MKKTASALALISALFFSVVAGTMLVNLAMANFGAPPKPATISILSPASDGRYTGNAVVLSFTVSKPNGTYLKEVGGVKYSVDSVTFDVTLQFINQMDASGGSRRDPHLLQLTETLTGLSEGYHTVTVSVTSSYNPWEVYWRVDSNTVSFVIDAIHPSITVLSPQNRTYLEVLRPFSQLLTGIQLNFTATEADLQIGYSLDGQANVTIAGNTTLSISPEGSHSLIIYVKDDAGNTASDTVYFTVETQRPESSESQQPAGFLGSTLPMEYGYGIVAVAVASVIAVAGYMLLRRKKQGGDK